MAQSGRSWNDPKAARGRASGAQPTGGSPSGSAGGAGSPGGGGAGRSSWRAKSAPAVAARGKDRHWLVSRTENPNRLRHRVKLAVAGGILLLLVACFLVYVLFGPRNTPLLLVGVLDYAVPLPPNAWTAEDFDRFRSSFLTEGESSAQNIRVYSDLEERQWHSGDDALLKLKGRLADVQPGGPGKKTVLVYLSGHGVVDAQGRPCLVLATDHGNGELWNPQLDVERLPMVELQSVLDTIQKTYAENIKKVVLLDANRIRANSQLGILENHFGEALKRLQFKDENLFLLNSTDVGQWGWTLPERRASAFGYYVWKGLAGRADDRPHGNENGEVTLDELVNYLRKQVNEEVQGRYLADQTPVLLSAKNSAEQTAETRLAWSHPEASDEAPDEVEPAVAWEKIKELWNDHETIKESGVNAVTDSTQRWRSLYKLDAERSIFYRGADLLSWEAFQQGLLRLELLNDAGGHYKNEAQKLAVSLRALADELKLRAQQPGIPVTLALRRVDVARDAETLVKKFIDAPVAEQDKEKFAALRQSRYEARAKAAWSRWVDWSRSLSAAIARDDFARTLALLAPAPGGSTAAETDPVEIRFLRLLCAIRNRDESPSPSAGYFAPDELFAGQALALRSAIVSRDLAEAAAWANDDVRAHYAIERLVEQGDRARRFYEDQLFIRPQALNATGEPWSSATEALDAEGFYKRALALAVELSSATDARDQAWQELPYLAQWLVMREETDVERAAAVEQLAACRQLFAQNKQLADAIDRLMEICLSAGEVAGDEAATRFAAELETPRKELAKATKSVRDNLDRLLEFHRRKISYARDAGAEDVRNLRQISDLLLTPQLTGEDRDILRQLLLKSRRNAQTLATRGSRTSAADNGAAKKIALAEHPLLALFGGEAASLASDTGRLEDKLRTELYKRFHDVPASPAATSTTAIERADRMKLTAAERQARAMAALWTLNPSYNNAEDHLRNPLAAVEDFDRHHAILWHAKRALEDFWGPVGDPQPQSKPYFEKLAAVALNAARALPPGDHGAIYKATGDTLAKLHEAATGWVTLNVPGVKLPPAGDGPRTVEARPTIEMKKIPAGQATLLAHRQDNETGRLRLGGDGSWQERLAVPTPLAKSLDRIAFELPPANGAAGSQTWQLEMFYRGHVVPTPVVFSPKEPGQQFVLKRETPPAPRIMVKGEKIDPGAITFIFDCSGSMGRLAVGGTRMDVAKDAFRSALEELADAGNYRVSVWFFGHRLIYDKDRTKRVLTVCEAMPGKKFPPQWCQISSRILSNDVALEWPLTPGTAILTRQNYPQIKAIVDVVQPAGTTPLYLSIVRAIEEDPNLKSDQIPRRLIVLTDGVNEVWDAEKDRRRTIESSGVVTAINSSSPLKGRQIQLHVVGFGDARPQEWTDNILPKIDQRTNYHDGRANRQGLEEVIRETIGLKKYQVTSGRETIEVQRVNRHVTVKNYQDQTDYEVRIVGSRNSAPLKLEGGEAIDLHVVDAQSANPRLVHERYDDGEIQASAMASAAATGAGGSAEKGKYLIGFHQPVREKRQLAFPISIQNADETLFTPRPAETWVEITPIGGAAQNKVKRLLFYDLVFDDGRPVPVLLCRANDWPAGARRARIDLFFKMDRTQPTFRPRLRDVEDTTKEPQPNPSLDLLTDGGKVQFTVTVSPAPEYGGAKVTVIEQCAREGDLHQAKVEVFPAADEVRRQHFHSADQQEVQHEFIYRGKTASQLGDYRLQITSRQDLERGALKLQKVVELSTPP